MTFRLQHLEHQLSEARREYELAKFQYPKLHGLIERKWRKVERLKRKIRRLR